MSFRTVFFSFFLMLVLFLESSAEKISGYVVDEENKALYYTAVTLMQSPDSILSAITVSDTLGYYEFEAKPGSYYLTFESMGFSESKVPIFEILEGVDVTIPNQVMKVQVTELEGVVINYKKPMIVKTARGLTVNVESSPVLQSGTAKQVIGKVPGVILNQDGSITLKGRSDVQIYIDGKRSFMSVETLMQWLDGLPASSIEKIEVFDTPPAKYDAAGSSGIINVVLKKGAALGFNGRVGVNLGYGDFGKASPSLSLNYRNIKYNAYGSFGSYYNKTFELYDSEYNLPATTDSTHFNTRSKSLYEYKGVWGNAGVDWFLGKKSVVGILFSGYSGGFDSYPAYNQIQLSGENPNNYNFVETNYNNDVYWNGKSINLNFEHSFNDSTKLTLDGDLVSRGSGFDQNMVNDRYNNGTLITPSLIETTTETEIKIGVIKADYEKMLGKNFSIETGVKATFVNTLNENKQFVGSDPNNLIPSNINTFEYDENVYAFYLSGIKKWKKWEGDFGFRTEFTYSKGVSPTIDSTVERTYLNLFPNVSLKRTLTKKIDLTFSYTRRIDRPGYWKLNPFEYQESEFAFYSGNPFLRPQYSDALTLGLGIENAVFFTLGFTNTSGAINEVKFQRGNEQNIIGTTINLDNIYNFNFNAVIPIPITKWWIFNFNSTVFYNQQISQFEQGNIDNSLWSYSLNVQQIFTLPKKYKIELSGYYNSDVFWNTYFVEPHYQLDLAVNKKIGRFDFNLALQDFLGIRESFGYNQQGDFRLDYYYAWETRQVRLNVGYLIGNTKVKNARKRKLASQEAQNRAD